MDNYIGPMWSDGRIQSSVPYGRKKPKSRADVAARWHDTAYALYSDRKHRMAADFVFHNSLKDHGFINHLIGDIVIYGNIFMNLTTWGFSKQDLLDVLAIPCQDPMPAKEYNPYSEGYCPAGSLPMPNKPRTGSVTNPVATETPIPTIVYDPPTTPTTYTSPTPKPTGNTTTNSDDSGATVVPTVPTMTDSTYTYRGSTNYNGVYLPPGYGSASVGSYYPRNDTYTEWSIHEYC